MFIKYSMKFFDSHFHIIDKKYQLIPNNGYLPNEFTVKDYLNFIKKYDFCGGAIVYGSFQGFDTKYILNALNILGEKYRGGSEDIKFIESFAHRIFNLCGMHIELYIDNINTIKDNFSISDQKKIFVDNAIRFYNL